MIVQRELNRVRDSRTLDEITDALEQAYQELMALGIFKAVLLVPDVHEAVRSNVRRGFLIKLVYPFCRLTSRGDALQHTDRCNIVAKFYERNLLGLRSGTFIQGTEGTAYVAQQ
jgi:hypothetical protein